MIIIKIKQKLIGWDLGSAIDYRNSYELYGGGVSTHPDVLDFIHTKIDCDPHYFIKRDSNGDLLGGVCTWGNHFFAGEKKAAEQLKINHYPLAFDELILPLAPKIKTILPFKSKSLSTINKNNIINSSYKINSKRKICLAKNLDASGFSNKTKARRNKEVRDFISAGGEIHNVTEYNSRDFALAYAKVFKKRRNEEPNNFSEIVDVFDSLKRHIFGHVLVINNEPCAMQLITKADSPKWISFDYINGGFNTDMESLCLGTIVTWLNVKAAFELCQANNKTMRYSFGRPTAAYKDRWCYQLPLARVLSV